MHNGGDIGRLLLGFALVMCIPAGILLVQLIGLIVLEIGWMIFSYLSPFVFVFYVAWELWGNKED